MQNYYMQWKSGFKKAVNWNKYQSDPKTYTLNQYLSFCLSYPSFQGVIRFFVLRFENENGRISFSEYYVPNVEMKLWWKNLFWSASNNR